MKKKELAIYLVDIPNTVLCSTNFKAGKNTKMATTAIVSFMIECF